MVAFPKDSGTDVVNVTEKVVSKPLTVKFEAASDLLAKRVRGVVPASALKTARLKKWDLKMTK